MDRLMLMEQLVELDLWRILKSRKRWRFVVDDAFHAHLTSVVGIEQDRLIRLAEIGSQASGQCEVGEVGVICTNGGEELALNPVAKRLGLRPLRLFGDLVPRRAAGADLRGVLEVIPETNLAYCILCLPRCGSTLLTKELELLNLGRPKELLRGPVAVLLRHREISNFDLHHWWTLVRANNVEGGVFGTKIIIDFLDMAVNTMLPEERVWFMSELQQLRIIRIIRRNKVDQVVSDHIARETGVWHLWNSDLRAEYNGKLAGVAADLDRLVSRYNHFVLSEERLDRMLCDAGVTPIDIDYDALTTEPKETVKVLVEQLGRQVPDDYLSTPLTLEPTRTEAHVRLAATLAERIG
jgi:LPS sulfotransferase NodH